jgi:hypothetical protein
MPLSPPVSRKPHHTRRIECSAHERSDALWDIEARMTDEKAYPVERATGPKAAGEYLHDMHVRLTLDERLTIRAIEVDMAAYPHDICPDAQPGMQDIVGLRIGAGWMDEVKRRVGGPLGCTHLRELLPVMATTAIQAIRPALRRRAVAAGTVLPNEGRPPRGSCWGWSQDEDRDARRIEIAAAAAVRP